ncbi:MAG: phage minor capsid protein [Roseburia sp.]|nr:phage minor capsid protein [Anaeroplasma bactoclasticum]MCM1195498.1 phage minor capsid protein [Roseburia sp.]
MDKEKEWVLLIEQANNQLKLALKTGIVDTLHKEVIKSNVQKIIDDTKNALKAAEAPQELIKKTENALKLRFVEWYTYITAQLSREAIRSQNPLIFKSYEEITGQSLKKSKGLTVEMDGYSEGTIPNIEDYMTTGRTAGAQSFMDGYVSTVKKAMQAIADKNLVMKDRLGRKMSIRNLAEMTARFQNTQERLQKLKDDGIEYVVASSHSNASERCQIWQGKIFILDCDVGAEYKQTVDLNYKPTPMGKIDGLDYYSLMDAMLHGFLGYNCRHRLVKYQKGMDLFNEYDANTIAKERNLEQKQRYLERKIRNAKEQASMAISPEDRKAYIEESKRYQEVYARFCHDKGLVRFDWRTRISKVEKQLLPGIERNRQPILNLNLPKEQYLIKKESVNFDYSKFTNFGWPSNIISFVKPKTGRNHIEIRHSDFVEQESNYLQTILKVVNFPAYISKDVKHGDNRINILSPTSKKNKYYHLSILLHPQENRILSCRYEKITNLDEKIASAKGYKGFIKIKKK